MTYIVLFDTDVLLRLKGHLAHLEVLWVESLGRQVEDLLELEGKVSWLNHVVVEDFCLRCKTGITPLFAKFNYKVDRKSCL